MERLNRIGAHRLLAAIDSAPIRKSPGILAIISNSDRDSVFSAGRVMTQAWTLLNNTGIAVHPYYVISDILTRHTAGRTPERLQAMGDTIAAETDRQFSLTSQETLCMLFRVGYPSQEPVRSRRLPLSAVLSDLSETGSVGNSNG